MRNFALAKISIRFIIIKTLVNSELLNSLNSNSELFCVTLKCKVVFEAQGALGLISFQMRFF